MFFCILVLLYWVYLREYVNLLVVLFDLFMIIIILMTFTLKVLCSTCHPSSSSSSFLPLPIPSPPKPTVTLLHLVCVLVIIPRESQHNCLWSYPASMCAHVSLFSLKFLHSPKELMEIIIWRHFLYSTTYMCISVDINKIL